MLSFVSMNRDVIFAYSLSVDHAYRQYILRNFFIINVYIYYISSMIK